MQFKQAGGGRGVVRVDAFCHVHVHVYRPNSVSSLATGPINYILTVGHGKAVFMSAPHSSPMPRVRYLLCSVVKQSRGERVGQAGRDWREKHRSQVLIEYTAGIGGTTWFASEKLPHTYFTGSTKQAA